MHAIESFPRHRLNIEAYHKMLEAGIFDPEDRIELIEGELLDMAPIGSNHAGTVYKLIQRITSAVGDGAIVGAQNPLILGDHTEVQPDLLVLKPREDYYSESHPEPKDIFFIVEVSDTTVRFDREVKIPLYAKFFVPEVWLIDLNKKCLDIHASPGQGEYKQIGSYHQGNVIPSLIDCMSIHVDELFQT